MISETKLLFIFTLIVSTLKAQAGGLAAPLDLPSAQVLPKGVRNIRYKGLAVEAVEKYDNQGSVVPLGEALNTKVDWEKIIDGKDTSLEKGLSRGYIENFLEGQNKNGIANFGEVVGETTGVVNVNASAQVPVFAIGVTEKLTMALAIPIIRSQVNVDTSFQGTSTLSAFKAQLEKEQKYSQAEELVEKTVNPIQEKLADYNYQPLKNEDSQEIGDIRLVSKYMLSKKDLYTVSLQTDLTLPTGQTEDVNKALNLPTGDGQMDVGMGLITDYRLNDGLILTHNFGYIAQLKDRMAKRVPEEQDSSLTPDIDPDVNYDLGDQMYTNVALRYSITDSIKLNTGYGLQYKEKDEYSGFRYDAERYTWIGQDTRQNMQTVQLGASYDTVSMFQNKKFAVPLGLSLNHTRVLSGKNVTADPLTSFEFFMFF